MRTLTAIVAAVAVTFSVGSARHARAFAQEVSAPAMSPADTNDLIRRRCVVCHSAAKPLGGLNFQLFDAAKPDPAVALMMSIKVSQDNALFAAGNPIPDRATIDAFVRVMRASADQSASGPWTIDLQARTNTGHSWVVARKLSDAGEVLLTCDGKTRRFEATPAQPQPDFRGLSPTLQGIFEWCIEGSPTSPEPPK